MSVSWPDFAMSASSSFESARSVSRARSREQRHPKLASREKVEEAQSRLADAIYYVFETGVAGAMTAAVPVQPIEESKANISRAFSECKAVHSFISARASSKGNYITYTYNIDLDSQEQMNAVYNALKQVPEIKFAL